MSASPEELDRLLAAAGSGDAASFHAVVVETQFEVRLHLAARSPDRDLVEELVQATFVEAWEGLRRYEGRGFALAWLKGIARNLLLQELRRRHRQVGLEADDLSDLLGDEASVTDAGEDEATLAVHLDECLQRLPPLARELIHRRYGEGHDLGRLAVAFKRKREALIALLYRLRGQLQACLDGKGVRP